MARGLEPIPRNNKQASKQRKTRNETEKYLKSLKGKNFKK